MSLDLSNINVGSFCDLNGVSNSQRNLMNKIYGNQTNSYVEWHSILGKQFKLHPMKVFTPQLPAAPEEQTQEVAQDNDNQSDVVVDSAPEETTESDNIEVEAPSVNNTTKSTTKNTQQ